MKRKNWEDKFATTPLPPQGGMTRSISHGDALKSKSKKSFPDESDDDDQNGPENGILREKVKVLQRQVADERKQRELLQDQVINVVNDNTSLWQQLDHVTKEAAVWREKLEIITAKYTDEITALAEKREREEAESQPDGSRPGSISPLTTHGPQPSILDEIADSLRGRFINDYKREHEENEHLEQKIDVLENNGKTKLKSTQTDAGLIIDYLASQGADPTVGRFERGPPEYKKLFKEIFDIIKKSQEDDALKASQPQRQRHTKQKKHVVYYFNQF